MDKPSCTARLPGALKSPEPKVPDHIYDMVLNPSAPINIPDCHIPFPSIDPVYFVQHKVRKVRWR
jgi:hypothetical protein